MLFNLPLLPHCISIPVNSLLSLYLYLMLTWDLTLSGLFNRPYGGRGLQVKSWESGGKCMYKVILWDSICYNYATTRSNTQDILYYISHPQNTLLQPAGELNRIMVFRSQDLISSFFRMVFHHQIYLLHRSSLYRVGIPARIYRSVLVLLHWSVDDPCWGIYSSLIRVQLRIRMATRVFFFFF